MRHHPHHSLVTEANDIETAASSAPGFSELTAFEAHRAAHPKVREVQDAALARAREALQQLTGDLPGILQKFVLSADQARTCGVYFYEFAESLPGRKITRDFYEQARHLFVDHLGRPISFELVEWLIRAARHHPDPITTMKSALECKEALALASGQAEFKLVGDVTVKQRIPPPDDWNWVTNFLEKPEVKELQLKWQAAKANPNYFPDGHLRPEIRDTMVHEWQPRIEILEGVLRELRAELGI